MGNTQVLAGGTTSLSAKFTHCSTAAAASGVLPRSSSVLTAGTKGLIRYPAGSLISLGTR